MTASEEDKTARSDDDKALSAPIRVTLVGVEHDIPLLPYAIAKGWRKKHREFAKGLDAMRVEAQKGSQSNESLLALSADAVDQLIELFFDYAPHLDREMIKNTASEPELIAAASAVSRVASPLSNLGRLVGSAQ